MISELKVSIKDEEKTLSKKFLIYDPFMVSENDSTIKACIEDVLANFSAEPSKITVKITMQLE